MATAHPAPSSLLHRLGTPSYCRDHPQSSGPKEAACQCPGWEDADDETSSSSQHSATSSASLQEVERTLLGSCSLCDHPYVLHLEPLTYSPEEVRLARQASPEPLVERCKTGTCQCPLYIEAGNGGGGGAEHGQGGAARRGVCALCGHKKGWHRASERPTSSSPSQSTTSTTPAGPFSPVTVIPPTPQSPHSYGADMVRTGSGGSGSAESTLRGPFPPGAFPSSPAAGLAIGSSPPQPSASLEPRSPPPRPPRPSHLAKQELTAGNTRSPLATVPSNLLRQIPTDGLPLPDAPSHLRPAPLVSSPPALPLSPAETYRLRCEEEAAELARRGSDSSMWVRRPRTGSGGAAAAAAVGQLARPTRGVTLPVEALPSTFGQVRRVQRPTSAESATSSNGSAPVSGQSARQGQGMRRATVGGMEALSGHQTVGPSRHSLEPIGERRTAQSVDSHETSSSASASESRASSLYRGSPSFTQGDDEPSFGLSSPPFLGVHPRAVYLPSSPSPPIPSHRATSVSSSSGGSYPPGVPTLHAVTSDVFYSARNHLALTVSPAPSQTVFRPGQKLSFQLALGPRVSLSSYASIALTITGESKVIGEPPDAHVFVIESRVVHPRVEGNGVEEVEMSGGRKWVFEVAVPERTKCGCDRGEGKAIPGTYVDGGVEIKYKLRLIGERKGLLTANCRISQPVQIANVSPSAVCDALSRVASLLTTTTTRETVASGGGSEGRDQVVRKEGDWSIIQSPSGLHPVVGQSNSVTGCELAWRIESTPHDSRDVILRYRLVLILPLDSEVSSALSSIIHNARVAVWKQVTVKYTEGGSRGKRWKSPATAVRIRHGEKDHDPVVEVNRAAERSELSLNGTIQIAKNQMTPLYTCNAEVRCGVSVTISGGGLLKPIKTSAVLPDIVPFDYHRRRSAAAAASASSRPTSSSEGHAGAGGLDEPRRSASTFSSVSNSSSLRRANERGIPIPGATAAVAAPARGGMSSPSVVLTQGVSPLVVQNPDPTSPLETHRPPQHADWMRPPLENGGEVLASSAGSASAPTSTHPRRTSVGPQPQRRTSGSEDGGWQVIGTAGGTHRQAHAVDENGDEDEDEEGETEHVEPLPVYNEDHETFLLASRALGVH